MALLRINEFREVQLDRDWLVMIPEFNALIKRDKGSKGDYRGDKKLQATKEFTFIYFDTDFGSPIRDWEDSERFTEALYYAGLKPEDIDQVVRTAQDKYMELQVKASRPLRTLKQLYKSLEALDSYFEKIDFTQKDKYQRLVNDPSDLITNAGKLKKMYDQIREFEKMVEEDLKKDTGGIRGPNSTLGDLEGQKKEWSELDIQQGSKHEAGIDKEERHVAARTTSFAELIKVTQAQAVKELLDDKMELEGLTAKFDKQKFVSVTGDDEEDDDQ